MNHTVGSYQAKTHLAELLDRVARGDVVTITRRGVPVAQIVPPALSARPSSDEVIADLISYSSEKQRTLGGGTVRDLVEEGRRY